MDVLRLDVLLEVVHQPRAVALHLLRGCDRAIVHYYSVGHEEVSVSHTEVVRRPHADRANADDADVPHRQCTGVAFDGIRLLLPLSALAVSEDGRSADVADVVSRLLVQLRLVVGLFVATSELAQCGFICWNDAREESRAQTLFCGRLRHGLWATDTEGLVQLFHAVDEADALCDACRVSAVPAGGHTQALLLVDAVAEADVVRERERVLALQPQLTQPRVLRRQPILRLPVRADCAVAVEALQQRQQLVSQHGLRLVHRVVLRADEELHLLPAALVMQ